MRIILAIPLALVLFAGAAAAAVERGSVAPEFKAWGLDGKPVKFSDLRAKDNVLLVFWSTDCTVSTGELPTLEKLQDAMRGKPLTVLGVNVDKVPAAKVAAWLKERKSSLRTVVDPKHTIWGRYEAAVTPTFVLVDPYGIVESRYAGGGDAIREALGKDVTDLVMTGQVAAPSPTTPTASYG